MIELRAPPGLYRLVEVDTYPPHGDAIIAGDYLELDTAVDRMNWDVFENPQMFKCYIYDDQGKIVFEAGNL